MSSPLALMRALVMTSVVLRRVRNCLSIIIIVINWCLHWLQPAGSFLTLEHFCNIVTELCIWSNNVNIKDNNNNNYY